MYRNGRDVHRELCGFYFLADGSITLYEFRQFGKKYEIIITHIYVHCHYLSRSNALPLIQRGVYHHCVGCRKGQPYEVRHIAKVFLD